MNHELLYIVLLAFTSHVQSFLGERTQLFLQDAAHIDVGDVSTVPTFTCPFLWSDDGINNATGIQKDTVRGFGLLDC